jgi:hypothetical protein
MTPAPRTRRERAEALAQRQRRILIDDFERLVEEFPDQIRAARKIRPTDPKHDALIRVAIRGFTLTSKVYKWDAQHFAYVKRRARLHFEGLGDGPMLFFCLAAGYLMGLAQEGGIIKPEFKAAEVQLDDIIRLNLQRLKDGLAAAMMPE